MKKTAEASKPTARVSLKDSVVIFKQIRNKKLEKAKNLLNDLISQKRSLDGKYYTNAAKEILNLLEDVEANAEALELNTEKLFIKKAVTSKGFRFMLPKSRWTHRGRKAKMCQLEVEVEER
jgi:ribosomal protein L22